MADNAPTTTQPLYFIDDAGNTVQVPQDQAGTAQHLGYALASPEQVRDYKLQEKYGEGIGNSAKAFGAGFLRTPTLGASDQVLTATGISSPEALKEREERNPIASTTGELAGIGASALATGGLGAAAEGGAEAAGAGVRTAAKFIPSNLVSSAGRAVEGAVSSALPAAGDTLASRIIASAVPKAAGSAIEGAFYAGGHEVSEQALGDPNQTAQSIIANVGLSSVMGGFLGGAIGVAEHGIPAAVSKAREAIGNAFNRGQDALGGLYSRGILTGGTDGTVANFMLENKQAVSDLQTLIPGVGEDLSHATPEMAQWMVENGPKLSELETAFPGTTRQLARVDPSTADDLLQNWKKITTDPKARIQQATQIRENYQSVFESVNRLSKQMNTDLVPAEEEALLAGADGQAHAKSYEKIYDQLGNAINKMRAEPELYDQTFARTAEALRDGLLRDADVAASPLDTFRRLRTLKQSLDESIPWNKGSMAGLSERNALNEMKSIRAQVKAAITDEGVFGPAAARRASWDQAQSEWLKLTGKKGMFRKLFMDADGKVASTKVDTWINALAKDKGIQGAEALGQFSDLARKLTDEAETTWKAAPTGDFSREGVDSLINKTAKQTQEAREAGQVTATMKYLKSGGVGIPNSGPVGIGDSMAMKGLSMVAPGAVTSAIKGALSVTNVPKTVATLAALERMGQKVGNAIEAGVSTLVRGGVKASYVARGEVAAGLAAHTAKSYDDQVKAYEKTTQKVTQLAQNFDQLHQVTSASTAGLYEHAPDTATALTMAQATAIHFLASKVPQHPKAGPLSKPWKPTPTEMGKFNRYHEAVFHPNSILKKAAAGTLQPEHVEAVRSVYPQHFAQIQKALVAGLAAHPKAVPYKSRQAISLILGVPADGSMTPASIRANQAAYAPQQQQSAGPKPTQAGLSKLTLSNRLLTPQQAAAQSGSK